MAMTERATVTEHTVFERACAGSRPVHVVEQPTRLHVEAAIQVVAAGPVQGYGHEHEHGSERLIRIFDNLGVAASTLCAIHCMVMPIVLAAVPALEANHAIDDQSHVWLAGLVVFFCMVGIVPGYLRHRDKRVLVLMSIGLAVVLVGTFVVPVFADHAWELPLMTFGNMFLIGAHIFNRRLCSCAHGH